MQDYLSVAVGNHTIDCKNLRTVLRCAADAIAQITALSDVIRAEILDRAHEHRLSFVSRSTKSFYIG